jgi:hypothetical protein
MSAILKETDGPQINDRAVTAEHSGNLHLKQRQGRQPAWYSTLCMNIAIHVLERSHAVYSLGFFTNPRVTMDKAAQATLDPRFF